MNNSYKIIIVFLGLFICMNQGYSQQWGCETISPETDYLTDVLGISYLEAEAYTSRNLNIYIHIIRRTNGTGGLTNAQVATAMTILSQDYENHDICFTEIGRRYLNSDNFYAFTGTKFGSLIAQNPHTNAIDIYLLPMGTGYGGRASGIPGSALVIGGNYAVTSVISHEMGHCVGLYHTHSGRGCNDFANCAEAINGSNCATCGDRVCDTPADPCLSGKVNTSCGYTGGGGFNPDTRNIQSYTTPSCMQRFTAGQVSRIHTMISNSAILLRVLNTTPCSGACVPNQTITQSLTGGTHEFLASNSITATNTISGNANVHYGANTRVNLKSPFRVRSGSFFKADSKGCTATKSTRPIDEEIAINTDKNTLRIYPNPSSGIFTVHQDGESAFITISDLAGKIVYQDELKSYVNQIDMSLQSKGIYVVKMNLGNEIKFNKIIIE